MDIQLSDHFNYSRILRFTLPSVMMLLFSSLYVIVDGLFVSNIVGSDALASVNIIMPAIYVIGAIGFMLAMGGNAQVAKTLGEGKRHRADQYFTLIILTLLVLGAVISLLCVLLIEPLCYLLGASERLIGYCVDYGRIILFGNIIFLLQVAFQTFFVTAEKPTLGLIFTIAAGLTNMILDYVFIALLDMGIKGAALATTCGYAVGGVIPVFYFLLPTSGLLHFAKPTLDLKMLFHSAVNGSSEMVSNLSSSLTTFLYNHQMMRLAGEDGVAAITVILYITFIFASITMGFSFGIAPVIGYHYGADQREELKNLFRRCMRIITVVSVALFVIAELTAAPLTNFFCGDNEELKAMTTFGFHLYAFSYLLCGYNIFGSGFFTALCNGKISAAISFMRTLIMEAGMILLLPLFIGIIGIWLAVPVAEMVTLLVVIFFLIKNHKKYGYF